MLICRPATSSDLPFLWEMLYFAASMHQGETEDRTAAMHHPELAPYLQGWPLATDLGSIAEQDGQPIGAAWLRLRLGEHQTRAYVNDQTPELCVAVYPEVSQKGVGTALLNHLIETAKPQFPAIALCVRSHNPAVHLYQRLGFEVVKEAENRVGGISYIMVKPLTGAVHA